MKSQMEWGNYFLSVKKKLSLVLLIYFFKCWKISEWWRDVEIYSKNLRKYPNPNPNPKIKTTTKKDSTFIGSEGEEKSLSWLQVAPKLS